MPDVLRFLFPLFLFLFARKVCARPHRNGSKTRAETRASRFSSQRTDLLLPFSLSSIANVNGTPGGPVGCGRSERTALSAGTFCAVPAHDGGTFNVRKPAARSEAVTSSLPLAGGVRFIFTTATAGTIQRRDRIRTLPLTRLAVPFSSPLRKAQLLFSRALFRSLHGSPVCKRDMIASFIEFKADGKISRRSH